MRLKLNNIKIPQMTRMQNSLSPYLATEVLQHNENLCDGIRSIYTVHTTTRDIAIMDTTICNRRCLLSLLNEHTFLSIAENTADTCVIGDGWHIESHTSRKAILVGFDAKASRKTVMPIVSAVTVVEKKWHK
jgi:hypothetical protein